MIPMCATCRWYDRIDAEHGRCADALIIDTDHEDGPQLVMATTPATNRCTNWGNPDPTRMQRVTVTMRRLVNR